MTMDQPTSTAADRLLSTAQLSARIDVEESTLRFWRWDNRGPKWFKLGRIVKYKESDVERWLDEQYAKAKAEQRRRVVEDPKPAV